MNKLCAVWALVMFVLTSTPQIYFAHYYRKADFASCVFQVFDSQ